MRLSVGRETAPGERRVALIPADVPTLTKQGWEVVVESQAGVRAGLADSAYEQRGATIVASGDDRLQGADLRLQIQLPPEQPICDRSGQVIVGMCDPLSHPELIGRYADAGASLLALELIPRITRAQSMDVLSSMATVAGYRAVLLAALELPRMFPLLMTAAGTLSPARVYVIGAGVAGLQAIATAKRLGGVVRAYDVREAAAEQVESLGAKFVKLELEATNAEDQGGYATAQGEDFYQRQRKLMAEVVAESDVVITTAAIPGRRSPVLIEASAVHNMHPGSVIVDLAAERGGNCELTRADERVEDHGVIILGPTNLPADVPLDASQMFSKNVTNLIQLLSRDGQLTLDLDDEVICGTLATYQGQVLHPRLCELLGRPVPERQPAADSQDSES